MAVELTFFGGAGNQEQGELGGVQLLVNDSGLDTKFLYEFGQRPDMTNDFHGFPYRPQSYQALDIYENLQLYAALPDIFRHDYELHRGKKIGPVPLDGMLLSHWHFDHNGGLPLLRHDLPIYMHSLHKQGMYVWQETSSMPSTRFLDVRNPFAYTRNKEGGHRYFTEQEASIGRDIRLFESEVPFMIGNIQITPYL
ncbi:MAG: MBL fold metallo-hydrolase, partial [Chrysiogenales bacterium]